LEMENPRMGRSYKIISGEEQYHRSLSEEYIINILAPHTHIHIYYIDFSIVTRMEDMSCLGCKRAQEQTDEDHIAHVILGMGWKPKHCHCHSCNAVGRFDDPDVCPCCGHNPNITVEAPEKKQ
jgi:hypothetical protein